MPHELCNADKEHKVMTTQQQQSLAIYGSILVALVAAAWAPHLVAGMSRSQAFTPHGYCLLWEPGLIWFSVVSDLLIGLSYLAISLTLVYLVYHTRREIPFQWIFLAFGAFIVACGITHFVDVWTVWSPVYYLAASTKTVTALASVATAVILPPLIPKTRALIEAAKLSQEHKAQLEQANAELQSIRHLLQRELDSKSQNLVILAGEVAQRTNELEQAVRSRDEFLSLAAHELNTPLTTLLGNAQLVERRVQRERSLPERDQRVIHVVAEQASRLSKLIAMLLDVSRIEGGQLRIERKPLDLAVLTERVVDQFRLSLEQHRLVMTTPGEPLLVLGDDLRLEQVLQNLLQNAVKYSPAGGLIEVVVKQCGTDACVLVRDYGLGIPESSLRHLFTRFYRAHNGEDSQISGMGIGLFVVKEIVTQHGGSVVATSVEGQGSTFTITLPRTTDPRA